MDDHVLDVQFASPAMNLLGFEYKATSDKDIATVKKVESLLLKHNQLFSLSDAGCTHVNTTLDLSDHIDTEDHKQHHDHEDHHGHKKHQEHKDHHNHKEHQATMITKSTKSITNTIKIMTATAIITITMITQSIVIIRTMEVRAIVKSWLTIATIVRTHLNCPKSAFHCLRSFLESMRSRRFGSPQCNRDPLYLSQVVLLSP